MNGDGTTSLMPAIDHTGLSDQEISDIIATMRDSEPKEGTIVPSEIRPVMSIMLATGKASFSVEDIDHASPRPVLPPEAADTVEFGKHVAQSCVGCHGAGFSGGPVPGGDPSWPPAANLTPHETGLAAWSQDDFVVALRSGKRPDGSVIDDVSMPWPAIAGMKDAELKAMHTFFASLPPTTMGER